ncbi:MAG: permease [Maritimibacter sp.]|nr:permease [Maritimibacter sp.]
MADTTHTHGSRFRPDGAWLTIAAIPVALAVLAPETLWPTLDFAARAIAHTGVFILFAVFAVAYMKATGAENLLARAFEGREVRMILFAAAAGGLSPFCSCEVIPFIAAALAVGAPLSAVMAFWLASPLMDPAMFLITSGELGLPFAVAKTVSAVGLGLFGGFTVKALSGSALFADPLKKAPVKSCGCGSSNSSCSSDAPFSGKVVWIFWPDPARRATFRETAIENILFLGKWLLLAYLIEALMLRYMPADLIAQALGGSGAMPVVIGALVGAPAYLNGFAAVPLVAGLIDQGMSNGAAMSFVVAGGVSCIPAAIAVWALVKPRVFAAYVGLAITGAILAGLAWGAVAG